MSNHRAMAVHLIAAMAAVNDPEKWIPIVQSCLDRAYSEGFADGYNERDTEIPTEDDE